MFKPLKNKQIENMFERNVSRLIIVLRVWLARSTQCLWIHNFRCVLIK